MFDAVVAGHLCLDIIPTFPLARPRRAGALLVPGGWWRSARRCSPPEALCRTPGCRWPGWGSRVRLVARLGADEIGGMTRRIIEGRGPGLADGLTTAPGEESSYTIVISPPGVDRIFLHCPGTNDTFGPEDVTDGLLREARLFHFGYPPLMRRMYAGGGAELAELLARARSLGATTSLDLSFRIAPRPAAEADWRPSWPVPCLMWTSSCPARRSCSSCSTGPPMRRG